MTLDGKVKEINSIKKDIINCHATLKNNLAAKDVEILPTDKMSTLIDKVKDIKVEKHTLPKWASDNEFYLNCRSRTKMRDLSARSYPIGNYLYCNESNYNGTWIWRYNIDTNTWDENKITMPKFPAFGLYSSFCKANNKVYSPNYSTNDNLQEYDIESNTVINYLCPVKGLMGSSRLPYCFNIGDSIFTQITNGYGYSQVEFNIITKTFTQTVDCPYTINIKGCFATNTSIFYCQTHEIIEYNSITKTFTKYDIRFIYPNNLTYGYDKFNNRLYLFGGYYNNGAFNHAFYFDTITKTYTNCTDLPNDRYDIKVGVVGENIYIYGGYERVGTDSNPIDEMYLFTNIKK